MVHQEGLSVGTRRHLLPEDDPPPRQETPAQGRGSCWPRGLPPLRLPRVAEHGKPSLPAGPAFTLRQPASLLEPVSRPGGSRGGFLCSPLALCPRGPPALVRGGGGQGRGLQVGCPLGCFRYSKDQEGAPLFKTLLLLGWSKSKSPWLT